MIKDFKNIKNYPLEKVKDNWPFGNETALELFLWNSKNQFSSFYEFVSNLAIEDSNCGETYCGDFLLENETTYFYDSEGEPYTLDNLPYSIIVCSAIKHLLNNLNTPLEFSICWSEILKFLIFTNYPVRHILEE